MTSLASSSVVLNTYTVFRVPVLRLCRIVHILPLQTGLRENTHRQSELCASSTTYTNDC